MRHFVQTPYEPDEIKALEGFASQKGRSVAQQSRILSVERLKQHKLLPPGPVQVTRKPYTRKVRPTRKGQRA